MISLYVVYNMEYFLSFKLTTSQKNTENAFYFFALT